MAVLPPTVTENWGFVLHTGQAEERVCRPRTVWRVRYPFSKPTPSISTPVSTFLSLHNAHPTVVHLPFQKFWRKRWQWLLQHKPWGWVGRRGGGCADRAPLGLQNNARRALVYGSPPSGRLQHNRWATPVRVDSTKRPDTITPWKTIVARLLLSCAIFTRLHMGATQGHGRVNSIFYAVFETPGSVALSHSPEIKQQWHQMPEQRGRSF